MDFGSKYNTRSPAVKRLMREAMEFHKPTDQYCAQPVEDNLFEWHFTVRGPPDTDFADGRYHGRIILPAEYPMKPPSIMLLTPNGRFETGKKICLSMSAHHPETWQPSWSIRTVLLAIIGFMPSKGEGAIGALDYTSQERKRLAKKSQTWKCDSCGCDNATCLVEGDKNGGKSVSKEALELASQISFKDAREKTKSESAENDRYEQSNEHVETEAAEEITVSSEEKSGQVTDDASGNRENETYESAGQSAGRSTEQSAEQQGQSDTPNVVRRRPIENDTIAENQPAVRKRTENAAKKKETDAKNIKQTKEKSNKSSGVISLILLWVIIIALVILIFRRLCLDTMIIGSS